MYKGENEDEMWDLYDENRVLTGKKHRRGDPLQAGEYHLVIHVCIFNSRNELLIQRRQPWKKGWPNMWDLTVGGSAVSGDSSQTAAMRETREELGLEIDLNGIRPHFTIQFDHGFDDYYMVSKDADIRELILQEAEVREVKWVNKAELLGMVERGLMMPYFFLDKIFQIKSRYGARVRENNDIVIEYAQKEHLDSWMNLAEILRYHIPGFETEALLNSHRDNVLRHIERKNAACALDGKQVVGMILFSPESNRICFLAVHPDYAGRHIATEMLTKALEHFNQDNAVLVDACPKENSYKKVLEILYAKFGLKVQ